MTNKSNHSESLVLFELAGNTCAVRSEAVQSVEVVTHITAVPNALPFVEGVTFTRGQVIPSINLRIRFGFPFIPVDPGARMLVVRLNGRTAALLVDSAREFISMPADAIQPPGDCEWLQYQIRRSNRNSRELQSFDLESRRSHRGSVNRRL